MTFFTRTLIVLAIVGTVGSVFRRDVVRILAALQKPARAFVRDVKRELEETKTGGAAASGTAAAPGAVEGEATTRALAGGAEAAGRIDADARAAAEEVRARTRTHTDASTPAPASTSTQELK